MDSQVFVYPAEQVCRQLDIPNTCTVHMPETSTLKPSEVLLWHPGLTLTQLRNSPLGKERMWQNQDWYDRKSFSAEPGHYAVQLRVPHSNKKNWQEQQSLLVNGNETYQPAPIAIACLALLLHLEVTGRDLLRSDWCRCKEEVNQRCRVVLTVYESRILIKSPCWDGSRYDYVCLAASRKF